MGLSLIAQAIAKLSYYIIDLERKCMVHQLDIEGGYNIRDLGDYPTKGGHPTRRGILIRSGNLQNLSAIAQQQVVDYGVKTIIDLRDEWETERFPNPFVQSNSVSCLNLPLIGNTLSNNPTWKAETRNYTALAELYFKYLDHCQCQLGTIVAAIAENAFSTLFYCHAGKDRTGIVAALLLGVVGVPDATIAEDYALSAAQITHLTKQWPEDAVQHGQDMHQFERDVASHPETMLSMLDYISRRYEGVANYLNHCGVSDNQLEHIRVQFAC